MKNINNNGVNVNKAANIGVNNNKEEMNMQNINNNGVNNEWLEVIEKYVKVDNARTLESMVNDGTVVTPLCKSYGSNSVEVEDLELEDGRLITIVTVDNLILADDPKIKKGLEVYIHDAKRGEIGRVLYLTVDGDEIGRDEVNYELQIDETVKIITNKKGERYMVSIKNNMVEIDEVKVITFGDNQFISESQLWETIGDERYTLPLIYVIENVIASYIENEDLDEAVEHHTNEIIKTIINKGEFIYVIRDGELQEVEGIYMGDVEAVEIEIPYLIELEQAADELWGFTRVVDNLDLRDDVKGEMMMNVFSDELYIFVHQYCREIWWDGGSN